MNGVGSRKGSSSALSKLTTGLSSAASEGEDTISMTHSVYHRNGIFIIRTLSVQFSHGQSLKYSDALETKILVVIQLDWIFLPLHHVAFNNDSKSHAM